MDTNKTIKNALSSVKEKELKLAIFTRKEIVQNAFELSNVMKTTLENIRSVVMKKGFKNEQDEIVFFKTAKPKISGRILFFQEVIKLETHSPENIEQQLKFYDNQIINYHNKLIDNELYNYFILDRKERDTIYFLRRNTFLDNRDYGFFFEIDSNFTTYYDLIVSEIICNKMLIDFCKKRIKHLSGKSDDQPTLKWIESKNALIELIYALHASNAIAEDNIKQIARVFESVFEIDLGDIHHSFHKMKFYRSKGVSVFIQKLKNDLENFALKKE